MLAAVVGTEVNYFFFSGGGGGRKKSRISTLVQVKFSWTNLFCQDKAIHLTSEEDIKMWFRQTCETHSKYM